MADFKNFRQTLTKEIANAQEVIQKHLVNTCVIMARDLAEATPVDTSRALSNWQVSDTRSGDYLLPYFSGHQGSSQLHSIGATLQHARDNARRYLDITTIAQRGRAQVYIINTAPYIQRLNEGWSPQQASGWIEDVAMHAFARSQRGAPNFFQGGR